MISSAKSWAVFIGVATVDIVLLIKLLTSQSSPDLLLAISVITTLLIFSFRFEHIQKAIISKDGLQIDLNNLNTRLEKTENNLTEAQAEIEANKEKVDNLFLLSMGPDLYMNLKKISSRAKLIS
ncbi:hypothetical protein MICAF_2380018 [Microcystis aeruginosa PCC 9807]|uniref:Uncharacterized protein n=1 Tax=Microcystis aeruginosa PCC 9807 TaxID=1160283 RepID=I4H4L8_MICAE|nr:hypothetical protein [Microcystis aeruginosa]CCI16992.1 hypothetical protein MICAF_2380018 [Microcystis aeruginosa PCC 9807]